MKLLLSGTRIALLTGAVVLWGSSGPTAEDTFFPYAHGWLGADAAYSIPLNQTATVWLFGDTFVGKRRAEDTMIHNSIAIRTCRPRCEVTYWWSGMRAGKPDSFFKTPESDYYWPLDGFVERGKLHVFLEQMHTTGNGGAFGFDYSGIKLATISNPSAEPDKWVISYRTIATGNQIVPGIAATLDETSDGSRVSVFTLFRPPTGKPYLGLMRFPVEDLASDGTQLSWEYLAGNRKWKAVKLATAPGDALEIMPGNITEMSIKYHPEWRKWLAIFPTPGFLTKTASFSTAADLSGPWTSETAFFEYPEMQQTNVNYTPSVFCYAAKEHPELEERGQVAWTYACNSMKEPEIFLNTRLYRPELVRESAAAMPRLEKQVH